MFAQFRFRVYFTPFEIKFVQACLTSVRSPLTAVIQSWKSWCCLRALQPVTLEGGIGVFEFVRAWHGGYPWNPRNKRDGRCQCDNRGGSFYKPSEPVVWMPNVPNIQYIRRTRSEDKDRKTEEHPTKCQVRAASDQINERNRDRAIGYGDQTIGNDVQPNYVRIPFITDAVWQESRRGKEFRKGK